MDRFRTPPPSPGGTHHHFSLVDLPDPVPGVSQANLKAMLMMCVGASCAKHGVSCARLSCCVELIQQTLAMARQQLPPLQSIAHAAWCLKRARVKAQLEMGVRALGCKDTGSQKTGDILYEMSEQLGKMRNQSFGVSRDCEDEEDPMGFGEPRAQVPAHIADKVLREVYKAVKAVEMEKLSCPPLVNLCVTIDGVLSKTLPIEDQSSIMLSVVRNFQEVSVRIAQQTEAPVSQGLAEWLGGASNMMPSYLEIFKKLEENLSALNSHLDGVNTIVSTICGMCIFFAIVWLTAKFVTNAATATVWEIIRAVGLAITAMLPALGVSAFLARGISWCLTDVVTPQSGWNVSMRPVYGLLVILSAYFSGCKDMTKSIFENLLKSAENFKKKCNGLEDVTKWLVDALEAAINVVRVKLLKLAPISLTQCKDVEAAAWIDKVMQLVKQAASKELDMNVTNAEMLSQLILEGKSIQSRLAKQTGVDATAGFNQLSKFIGYLETLEGPFKQACCTTSGLRVRPTIVLISGAPGVGKTQCAIPIIASVGPRVLPPALVEDFYAHMMNYVYVRNAETKFWDGYSAHKKFMVIDDFFQMRDVPGVADNEIMDLIRCGSAFPNMLHMADLSAKGVTMFRSEMILCTSNQVTFHPNSIHEAEALNRRFDIIAVTVPRPEFCTPETKDLPIDKRRLAEGAIGTVFEPKIYEFHIQKYRLGKLITIAVEDYDALCSRIAELMRQRQQDLDEYCASTARLIRNSIKLRLAQPDNQFEPDEAQRMLERIDKLDKAYAEKIHGPQCAVSEGPSISPSVLMSMVESDGEEDERPVSQGLFDWPRRIAQHYLGRTSSEHNAILQAKTIERAYWLRGWDMPFTIGSLETWVMEKHPAYVDNIIQQLLFLTRPAMGVRAMLADQCSLLPPRAASLYDAARYAYGRMEALFQPLTDWLHVGSPLTRLIKYVGLVVGVVGISMLAIKAISAASNASKKKKGVSQRKEYNLTEGSDSAKIDTVKAYLEENEMVFTPAGADKPIEPDLVPPEDLLKIYDQMVEQRLLTVDGCPVAQPEGCAVDLVEFPLGKFESIKRGHAARGVERPKSWRQKRAALGQPVESQMGWNGSVHDSAVTHFKRNICYMTQVGNKDPAGVITFIHGRFFMFNTHYYYQFEDEFVKNPRLKVVVYNFYRDKYFEIPLACFRARVPTQRDINRDWMIGEAPLNVQPFPSIYKHFVSQMNPILSHDNLDALFLSVKNRSVVVLESHCQRNAITIQGPKEFLLEDALQYPTPTRPGDCGSWVVYSGPKSRQLVVLGIHAAGTPSGSNFGTLVYREDLGSELLERGVDPKLQDQPVVSEGAKVELVPMRGDEMGPEYNALFKAVPARQTSNKTKIIHSPLYGKWGPAKKRPARLVPFERNGSMLDPMKMAVERYAVRPVSVTMEQIRAAINAFFLWIQAASMITTEREVLTWEESILGVEGVDSIPAINRGTSAGFPFALFPDPERKGKTRFFGVQQDFDLTTENCRDLQRRVNEIVASAAKNVRRLNVFTDNLKDELRPIAKVQEGKSRLFSGCPVDYMLCVRMYYMAFVSWIIENRIVNGIAVGVNPYSREWTKIVLYLRGVGNNFIAGDFKAFDAHLSEPLLDAIGEMIHVWYSDEHENIRSVLWQDVYNSRHICGDVVYEWFHGLPSGHPLTTIINCIANHVLFRIAFSELCPDHRFEHEVRLIAYGDDNVLCVSDEVRDQFNQHTLEKFFASVGMTYTPEDKGENVAPWRALHEISFLKRGFMANPLLPGDYIAPLELATVLEMPYWTKDTADAMQICADNTNEALHELTLHGLDVFLEYGPKIFLHSPLVGVERPFDMSEEWRRRFVEVSKSKYIF